MAVTKPAGGGGGAHVPSDPKGIARAILEAFNTGDTSIVDAVFHPHFLSRSPTFPGTDATRDGLKKEITQLRAAFPDAHFTVDNIEQQGDKVTIHWTMTGTQRGPILGVAPSNEKVTQTGTEVLQFHENKIIARVGKGEAHEFEDKLRTNLERTFRRPGP